jgi:hypothetical protein
MIEKAYKAFLWLMGFPRGEYITFMWRRQEKRLGVLWWVLVASTEALAVVWFDSWHYILRPLCQFVICLLIAVIFWHVATGKIPDNEDPT